MRVKKEGTIITIKLQQDLSDKLNEYTEETGFTKTAVIQKALKMYFESVSSNDKNVVSEAMSDKVYRMETAKVHEVQAATRGGRGISCLDDLIRDIGIQKTNWLFSEYVTRLASKQRILNEIGAAVEHGSTIEDVKKLLSE